MFNRKLTALVLGNAAYKKSPLTNAVNDAEDISERLKKIDFELANNIDNIIKEHLDTRHIRGGEITKQKYKGKKL